MTDAKTRIVFTGDIVFSGAFSDGWQGDGCLSEEVVEYLRQADHVVGNVECPLTNEPIRSTRQFSLSASPEAGKYLAKVNIRNWVLANNHIMDCGAQGLLDTVKAAVENGCRTLGVGNNESAAAVPIIVGDSIKIGIVSAAGFFPHVKTDKYKTGALTADNPLLCKAIRELRETVDWVVVTLHIGDEFCDMPMPYTRDQFLRILDVGADVVIGHHPHVIQNYEYVGDKLIVYSLGNFIFDSDRQRNFDHTETGVLVGLDFNTNGFSFDGFPVSINREDNIVEKGSFPAVFCNIDAADYHRLWPLAAKEVFHIDVKKKRLYNKRKRMYKYKGYVFLRYLLLSLRDSKTRVIQKGKLISLIRKNNNTKLQNVVEYMST